MGIASELDSMDHIGHVSAVHDHSRVFLNYPVPDRAAGVIATVVRTDQFAMQMGFEVLQGSGIQRVLNHTGLSSMVRRASYV